MKERSGVRRVIAEREEELPTSEFVKIVKIAEERHDVISLGPGEPDFDTPKNIIKVAKKKLDQGFTHYTPIGGRSDTKKAIAKKLKKENKIDVNPESQVIVTVGAKEAILLSLMSLVDPGEAVLIPDPGYLPYRSMADTITVEPLSVRLKMEDGFEYDIDEVKKVIEPKRTKAMILNSPSNPTGTVFTKKKLEEIADFAIDNSLVVISDEAYEKFVYDGSKHISIGSLNGMHNHVVSIFSFSKSYAMPGFRIGYACGPRDIIQAMTRLKMGTTLSTPTISQLAAIEALKGPQESVKRMVKEYDRRRRFMWRSLNEMGMECLKPKGAFYMFPKIPRGRHNSTTFAHSLLHKTKVLVVPGTEFGKYGEGFVRMSYATSYQKIVKAMGRIEKVLK
ncbi:MAG: pyridoxal phosphate-dependent aminotransferase [Candidatus Aenigmarchaeota archaeon]|nr:pyridoxal phosphate-dependent aminotransferase [Candidatus Aenigmarchaeota archaeon]